MSINPACQHASLTWLRGAFYHCHSCGQDLRQVRKTQAGVEVIHWYPARVGVCRYEHKE